MHFDEFNEPGISRLLDFEQHSYAPDFGDKNVQMSRNSAFVQENTRLIIYMPRLAQSVPFTLKQKNWANKVVHMKDLIRLNSHAAVVESSRLTIQTSDDGTPVLVQVPVKRKPIAFNEYQAGWRLYKAVYLTKYPEEIQAMLVYENDISTFASQGLYWNRYDEDFRRGREADRYPWDTMRPELERNLHMSRQIQNFRSYQKQQGSLDGSEFSARSLSSKRGFPTAKGDQPFLFPGENSQFSEKEISFGPTMVDTVRKPTHMKYLKCLQDIVTDTIGVRDATHSVGMITPVSNVQESISMFLWGEKKC